MTEVLQGSADGYYYDGYDAAGRVTSGRQITTAAGATQSYSMNYKYDLLAGNLTSQTYPSNKEYRTNFDNAGRVASVSRYNSGVFDKTYVSQFSFAAHGAVAAMTFGNNLVDKTEFNSRLQPTFIKLGTISNPTSLLQLGYTYSTPGQPNNNGNVLTQTITAPTTGGGTATMSQSYDYDAVNRLSTASETGAWSQIRKRQLENQRAELTEYAKTLASDIKKGVLTSKEAIDKFYDKAKELTGKSELSPILWTRNRLC